VKEAKGEGTREGGNLREERRGPEKEGERRPEKKGREQKKEDESADAHLRRRFTLPVHKDLLDTLLHTPPE
jgi:hypothetical protein